MAAVSPDGWRFKLQSGPQFAHFQTPITSSVGGAGSGSPTTSSTTQMYCSLDSSLQYGFNRTNVAASSKPRRKWRRGRVGGFVSRHGKWLGKPPMDAHFESKRNSRLLPQFGAWGCRQCDSESSNVRLLVCRSGRQSSMGTRAQLAGFVSSPVSKLEFFVLCWCYMRDQHHRSRVLVWRGLAAAADPVLNSRSMREVH